MSDVQTLPFTPLVIGIAGIIAASAAFYFMNKQSPSDKDNKPQEPVDLSFADTPQKETQKRRTKKKKEIIVPSPPTTTPSVKEENLPKTKDIIKEEPKPQTESHSAPKKTEQTVKEVKQTTEETKKAKKKKNKPSANNNNKNNEQPKQQQQSKQQQKQQTLLEDILTGNDDGEWEEIVKYKKSDKDKSRKLQQKIQQQHDEYLSQF